MRKQKITLETNGKYKNTVLKIDNKTIYFDSISINGTKESDFDIVIGLSCSRISEQEIKQQCTQDAIGFVQSDTEEEYYEESE